MIDYEKQAVEFLERFGITFKADYVSSECPPFCTKADGQSYKLPCGGIHGGKYTITLQRKQSPGCRYCQHPSVGDSWTACPNCGKADQPIMRSSPSISFPYWNSYADEYEKGDKLAGNLLGPANSVDGRSWYKRHLDARRRTPSSYYREGMTPNPVIATPPTPYGVLANISSDAHCPDTFEEWCLDFGYDTDSRKAEAAYRICKDFAYKLVKFFTTEELEALSEIH